MELPSTSMDAELTRIRQERMDAQLHEAARDGNTELLKRIVEVTSPPDLTRRLTPKKNTVLHIAVQFGHRDFVEKVIQLNPSLISQQNSKGDIPLHMAARAGHLDLTVLLTSSFKEGASLEEAGADALRMQNSDGYTAIHEALKKKKKDVARHLLKLGQSLVGVAPESLLFLASEAGLVEVMEEIIERGNFVSTEGPKGLSALHIAVITGNLDAVQVLARRIPNLLSKVDDHGKTALHYACTIDNNNVGSSRMGILKQLIEADSSVAYIPDSDGNYPIHIATIRAPFEAVETILKHCPDSAELVDRYERNALHLAVLKKREDTFRSLLKRPEYKILINEPDSYGNTPMHLATLTNNYEIVEHLLQCEGVDWAVTNRGGYTAMDYCGYTSRQQLIRYKMKELGAVPGRQQWQETLFIPPPPKFLLHIVSVLTEVLQLPPPPITSLTPGLLSISHTKSVAKVLSIVTTLVATVTFAAAFTVPGGYKDDGPDLGVPVFLKSSALKTFLVSDILAFCGSMAATILLLFASANLDDELLFTSILNTCAYISAVAIPATITAFMAGLYVVTSKESFGLAIVTFMLGCGVVIFVLWRVKKLRGAAALRTLRKKQRELERYKTMETDNTIE